MLTLKFVFIYAPPTSLDPPVVAYPQPVTMEVTLSDPYTASEVNDDVNALLACWNLQGRPPIPWRLDGNSTERPAGHLLRVRPVVTRLAGPAGLLLDGSHAVRWQHSRRAEPGRL